MTPSGVSTLRKGHIRILLIAHLQNTSEVFDKIGGFSSRSPGPGEKVLTDRKVKHRASQAWLGADGHGREVRFPKAVGCPTMLLLNPNHTHGDFIYSALAGDPETPFSPLGPNCV